MELCIEIGIAAFVGLMVVFACYGFGLHQKEGGIYIIGTLSGIFGFLGGNGMLIGIHYFFGRLGIKLPDDKQSDK